MPMNEKGSKRPLKQLIRNLQRNDQYQDYNNIIQEQLNQGVVETAHERPSGKEFYIPHKTVARKDAETTKFRIVYDAKEINSQPSPIDCLHQGPPL